MSDDWSITRGEGPVSAVALHAGHDVREDFAQRMVLPDADRLREEDPYTDAWASCAPTQVSVSLSRFVTDLNRPREGCVYRTPDESWGLKVYDPPLDGVLVDRALVAYDDFYKEMEALLSEKVAEHGSAIVLDLHSYNHRRGGATAPPDDPAENPEINIGTGTVPVGWADVVRACSEAIADVGPGAAPLDVRENVRFRGGGFAVWAHGRFEGKVCVLALEAKKTFMDEWSGELYAERHRLLGEAFGRAAQAVLEAHREMRS